MSIIEFLNKHPDTLEVTLKYATNQPGDEIIVSVKESSFAISYSLKLTGDRVSDERRFENMLGNIHNNW